MTKLLTTLIVFGNVFCMISCSKRQEDSDPLENLSSVNNLDRNGEKNGWGWSSSPAPQPLPICLDPSEIVLADNVNLTFFETTRLYYVSAKTDFGYRRFGEMFLGRPATDAELDTMCVTKFFGNIFFEPGPVVNSGLGVQFTEICGPVDANPAVLNCVMDLDQLSYDGNLGVNPTIRPRQQTFYLLKTDSRTYAISYICIDGVADYQIKTMNRFLTPEQMVILKETVAKYGFDPNEIKYSPCAFPGYHRPYPNPFQNYPNPPGQVHGWSRRTKNENHPN